MSISTSPAPVTPPPRLGARPPDLEPPGTRTGRRLTARAGDGVALLVLATVLWWLAGHDGGRNLQEPLPAVWVVAAFLPWAPQELRRLPKVVTLLIAGLVIGALLSIAFGTVRTGFEEPAVTFATTVLTGLAAHRLWRRDWGPVALLLMLVVSFGLYWQRSFLQWWGGAGSSGTQWLALSWHNQSGTLMAAFGVLFLGVAAVGRRLLVPVGLLLSAGGLAGTWLSGSRGALAATVVGLAVVGVIAVRERGSLRTATVAVTATALTVGVVGWLTFIRADVTAPTDSASQTSAPEDILDQPVFERQEDATSNAWLRLQHIQAAAGMFVDRPLTGHGLGSYGPISIRWSSPDANLTRYAHNRYVQSLGEGGLVTGVPLIGLLGALGVLAWRRLRTRSDRTDHIADPSPLSDARVALTAGLTGAAALVAVHSLIDFDWTFPVLPMLLAIAAGALTVDHTRGDQDEQRSAARIVGTAAIGLLLVVGSAAHLFSITGAIDPNAAPDELVADFRPWQADRGITIARMLSERELHAEAETAIEQVASWSPGLSTLPTERAVIAYRSREATAEDVASTLEVGDDWFGSFNLAATALIEGGDHEVAEQILQAVIDAYPSYDAWDSGTNEARSYALLVTSLGRTGRCEQASSTVDAAPPLESVDLEDVLATVCP